MSKEFKSGDLVWSITTWGDPLGMTYIGSDTQERMIESGIGYKTREEAERLSRKFKAYLSTIPRKEHKGNRHWTVCTDGVLLVSGRSTGTPKRMEYGNYFTEQSEAGAAHLKLLELAKTI